MSAVVNERTGNESPFLEESTRLSDGKIDGRSTSPKAARVSGRRHCTIGVCRDRAAGFGWRRESGLAVAAKARDSCVRPPWVSPRSLPGAPGLGRQLVLDAKSGPGASGCVVALQSVLHSLPRDRRPQRVRHPRRAGFSPIRAGKLHVPTRRSSTSSWRAVAPSCRCSAERSLWTRPGGWRTISAGSFPVSRRRGQTSVARPRSRRRPHPHSVRFHLRAHSSNLALAALAEQSPRRDPSSWKSPSYHRLDRTREARKGALRHPHCGSLRTESIRCRSHESLFRFSSFWDTGTVLPK
jgi:hypothetical protein